MITHKTRDQIDDKYKWNLSVMYPSDASWEEDYRKAGKGLSRLLEFKGSLADAGKLGQFIEFYINHSITRENLYVYANVRFYEDTRNAGYEEMKGRIELLTTKISAETVFIKKELSSLSKDDIDAMIRENAQLAGYRFFLESYARYHPHILSEETETVLAELEIALKKEGLGIEELHFYDNYVPLVKEIDKKYSYEEAIELVRTALEPLGAAYLRKYDATIRARVIDVFESSGKRSGAFSWGSYASRGLIFLNYTEKFSDVSTFAHEFGHCLHRDYSIENQPYIYYQNPIFLAEVASTFNEVLLFDYMSKIAESVEEKKFFLYHNMKRIEGTFFRQTMFANFEKDIYEMAESGKVLMAKSITEIYRKNLETYLGKGMVIDEQLNYEWARIPHFYHAFYVYKYATSLSAAIALSERVISGEKGAVEGYLRFLGAGSHKEPLEILKDAGIDLSGKEAYKVTVSKFRKLLKEYKAL